MTMEKELIRAALEWCEAARAQECSPTETNAELLVLATVALIVACKRYLRATKN